MDNQVWLASMRRASVLLVVPALCLAFALGAVLCPITWIFTGKSLDDQIEWIEDRNEDYWDWVKR